MARPYLALFGEIGPKLGPLLSVDFLTEKSPLNNGPYLPAKLGEEGLFHKGGKSGPIS